MFFINMDMKLGWYEKGDKKKDGKYVGEIQNSKPNGQETHTHSNGEKYAGEWKGGNALDWDQIQLKWINPR